MKSRHEGQHQAAERSERTTAGVPGKQTLTGPVQRERDDSLAYLTQGAPAPSAEPGLPASFGVASGVSFVDSLITGPVQRADEADGGSSEVHAAASLGVSGGGGSLPHQETIQRSFGRHDVSGIVAHTDARAEAGAQAMGASAFATGDHVAFARSSPDLHTAAHEATHVVQQRAGVHLQGGVGQSGDPYERHADAVADLVVQGQSAEHVLDQYAGAPAATDGAVQRQEGGGGGGAAADPFEQGTFLGWPMIIVPDDYRGRMPRTNWIYRRYKTRFETLYTVVEGGTGRIKITEAGPDGTVYAGFRDKMLKAIKRLMTVVPGRELIQNLEDGGFDVTIQPDPTVRASANATARTGTPGDALRNADGTAGAGTSSTIFIDPNQSNRTQRVFDRDGNETSFPLFINLGHEMIHAMHNQRGENERNNAATDADYTNREEELSIDGPGLSENRLRRSFGLTERHGHGGTTTAHSTATVSGGATGG